MPVRVRRARAGGGAQPQRDESARRRVRDRPGLLLAEGVLHYLGETEVQALLNAVVEDPKAEAEEWASAIAGYAPAAVQATKRLALLSRRLSDAERSAVEAARALVEGEDDYKHGAAAFAGRG